MAKAAHRQKLRALGKRRVLKCCCDTSAVQRQVDSSCVIASQIKRRRKGLREADEALPSGSGKAESQPSAEAPEDAPPTRAEMLEQAERIGLKVDGRWSDARLLDAIVAKMKEQAP